MVNPSVRRQRGRSLLEIFVALAIGAVIIAAVLATIGTTGVTGRRTDVQARMAEDAQVAFSLMAPQLRMGGASFDRVVRNAAVATRNGRYAGAPLDGCDTGYADPTAVVPACGGGANAAFRVMYEADNFNTVPDAVGRPTDCLGRPIQVLTLPNEGVAGAYALAENRYFIAVNGVTGDPELFCVGSGGAVPFANPVPLVGNVEAMRVRYHLRHDAAAPNNPTFTAALTAAQVTAGAGVQFPAPPVGQVNWDRVTAIEVCLLMRSADNVATAPTPYVDCAGNVVNNPPDRRVRRAVVTTMQVRNGARAAV